MPAIDTLRRDPALADWMTRLDGATPVPLDLPRRADLAETLLDLAVPHDDISVVMRLSPLDHADTRWLLERSLAILLDGLGTLDDVPDFPAIGDASNPMDRYVTLWMYVAALPYLRAWYDRTGLPESILRASIRDVGRQMALNRLRRGIGGLQENAGWPAWTFRGRLFQLGRLQFERCRVGGTTAAEVSQGGYPLVKGDAILAVHIPDYLGPFDPAACEDAFDRARTFFSAHFPGESHPVVSCHSWLMAHDLARYLPPSSNILAFQRRFTITDRERPVEDDEFFRFVFGTDASSIDTVPQETSLQRAIVRHIRQGNHWRTAVGWCRLDHESQVGQ